MAWPAFLSGFPLMYPDTPAYLLAGRRVAAAILLNHRSSYYGGRSLIYSLGIFPFHLDRTVWPVAALQCLLTSWLLWLVFRSISPRKSWIHFLILIALLSLLSSLSWFGSFIMPDILGPDLYLCIFLLVFAPDTISRAERVALYLISWWAIVSHATHLLIVIALCCALTAVAIFKQIPLRRYLAIAAELAIIIVLAVGAQISLNAFLYGQPSLGGDRPPFLTARLVADGPGRWYLEKHCPESGWEMCRYVNNLSGSSNRFLWSQDGVWVNATLSSRKLILSQDQSLAIAIFRAYPREQFVQSLNNFLRQLVTFDLGGFGPHFTIDMELSKALPKAQWLYFESRQAHNQLPRRLFYWIQHGAVVASLVGLAILLPWFLRSRPMRLIALGFVIAAAIVANALFTSTLSTVDGRFGSRAIWLVPFFAVLCILQIAVLHRRATSTMPLVEEIVQA